MVYLQITVKIAPANRPAAAGVYQRYKTPLSPVGGSASTHCCGRGVSSR